MAAIGHIENYLFYGFAYSAVKYIDVRVSGVEEFISDIVSMISYRFDLQIQDGRRFSIRTTQFFKMVMEPSCWAQIKALLK